MSLSLLANNFSFFSYPGTSHTSPVTPKSGDRILGKNFALDSFFTAYCSHVQPIPDKIERKIPNNKLNSLSDKALFLGDPVLYHVSKYRSHHIPSNYSLLGITHTLSTPPVLSSLASLCSPSICPWDALICTSQSAHNCLNESISYHSDRLNVSKPDNLQLPIIPLGINCSDFQQSDKSYCRSRLNIGEDSFVCLWVGRLELHCKAHHASTLRVLEAVAQRCPDKNIVLLMYGTAVMPNIIPALLSSSKDLAPSISLIYIDGHESGLAPVVRGAADIFISLVDSFQETFGLSPVEAMCSGLPVICSDWNGYRDSVVNGLSGYLIPTSVFGPVLQNSEADYLAYCDADTDYSAFLGSSSVIIDEPYATHKIIDLVSNPSLLQRLSANARYVGLQFDWSIIFQQYESLLGELSNIRRHFLKGKLFVSSEYQPFVDLFKSWPTRFVSPDVKLVPNPLKSFDDLVSFLDSPIVVIYSSFHPQPLYVQKVYNFLLSTTASLDDLYSAFANISQREVDLCLSFLLKHRFLLET